MSKLEHAFLDCMTIVQALGKIRKQMQDF